MEQKQRDLLKKELSKKVNENVKTNKSAQQDMIEKYKNIKNDSKIGNNINEQR